MPDAVKRRLKVADLAARAYRLKAADLAARARGERNAIIKAELARLAGRYLRLSQQASAHGLADVGCEQPARQQLLRTQQSQSHKDEDI